LLLGKSASAVKWTERGHPVGAAGGRITANLVHELRRTGGRYAIGSACIGGGQGIAILLENVQ
jgi:acetyl-CoA acyltransferase 2